MQSNRDRIVDRIKKCLALSASSNEHEAEAALRQARKLMQAHGITEEDVHAAEAEERRARSRAAIKPAAWEVALACKISDAFGCEVLFAGPARAQSGHQMGEWAFIGCGVAPEVGCYAFTVLLRQATRARGEYLKLRLRRCKPATKTRRADLFCEGWVRAVTGTINSFAGGEKQEAAIAAYVALHYPSLRDLKTIDRNVTDRGLSGRAYDDLLAGHQSGRAAQLHRGMGGAEQMAALT